MSTTFDHVLSELVRTCETSPEMESIESILAVRDLKGCVRLVIRPRQGESVDLDAIESEVSPVLGGYFKKPILSTDAARPDEKRLADELLRKAENWSPVYEDPATLSRVEGTIGKWKKVERRLSKQEWLLSGSPTAQAPWDMERDKPAIATFYSFKGGVGRTTALVSCAWQLAAAGKQVCVVDLDLEAPGLSAMLNVQTERGVLDYLVDFVATGVSNLTGCHAPAKVMGDSAVNVDVIPAGKIDLSYLEKLSRLDFVGTQTFEAHKSPVQRAMEAFLGRIHGELHPDYILLDSRAGLHDLAGLSLHGLAHVDIIVARASEQSYAGIDLTLQAIGIRKEVEKLLTVIVHSFAPPDEESPIGKQEREEFRNRVYSYFVANIYSKLTDDDPQEEDTAAPHSPVVLAQNQDLERFTSLSSPKTKEALFGRDYVQLLNRIEELCNVSSPEAEEEEP